MTGKAEKQRCLKKMGFGDYSRGDKSVGRAYLMPLRWAVQFLKQSIGDLQQLCQILKQRSTASNYPEAV